MHKIGDWVKLKGPYIQGNYTSWHGLSDMLWIDMNKAFKVMGRNNHESYILDINYPNLAFSDNWIISISDIKKKIFKDELSVLLAEE